MFRLAASSFRRCLCSGLIRICIRSLYIQSVYTSHWRLIAGTTRQPTTTGLPAHPPSATRTRYRRGATSQREMRFAYSAAPLRPVRLACREPGRRGKRVFYHRFHRPRPRRAGTKPRTTCSTSSWNGCLEREMAFFGTRLVESDNKARNRCHPDCLLRECALARGIEPSVTAGDESAKPVVSRPTAR